MPALGPRLLFSFPVRYKPIHLGLSLLSSSARSQPHGRCYFRDSIAQPNAAWLLPFLILATPAARKCEVILGQIRISPADPALPHLIRS